MKTTAEAGNPRTVIDSFVKHMAEQNLPAVVALYGPGSVWEAHVPGWDGLLTEPAEMLDLHQDFFGRQDFRVDERRILADGEDVALRWNLSWTDRSDGAPCLSFQRHFFQIRDGLIHRHQMYCAGVRVASSGEEEAD